MEKKSAKVVSRWEPLPDNATTMQVMVIPEVDEHQFQFDGMSHQDLLNFSKYIDQSNKSIETENMIIERYLNRTDPNALAKMSQILEAAAIALKKIEKLAQFGGRSSALSDSKEISESKSTFCSSSESQRTDTTKSGSTRIGFLGDKRLKVQPLQKIEIVNREMDELRIILENFRKKANKFNNALKCRNEELSSRLAEIVQAQYTFDHKLLVEDVDPKTGTLPGEKFLRYLEKRLKMEEMEVNRLRIKTGCLKNHLKRVKAELTQKKEMAEEFDTIDFEVLRVENQECQDILDEKAFHLLHLKKTSATFESAFNSDKKKLKELMEVLAQLQRTIVLKNSLIKTLQENEERMDSDVTAAALSLKKIKWLMKSYTVPDVMDYIQKKVELHKLKKNLKVMKRQIKLKKMILSHQVKCLSRKSEEFSKPESFSSLNLRESGIIF